MSLKLHIFFFLLLCASGFSQNDMAGEAEKAYREKHYREAIRQYESLVQQGYTSSKLYYNLGNAYYRDNQLGKAIYNYELAQKLSPKDEDVINNLAIANSKTIDKIDAKTNFFASVLKARLVNSLDTTRWAWLSIGSLVAALLLLFCFISASGSLVKRIGFFTSLLSFVLFIATMVLGFIALNSKHEITFGIVIAKECKTYSEPQDSDKQKFVLHEGTRVKVLDTNDAWTSIKLENGNEGWVKTQELGLF